MKLVSIRSAALLATLALAMLHAAGCGSKREPTADDVGLDDGGNSFANADGSAALVLDVKPKDPVLDYATVKTQQFDATLQGTPTPATWSLDNGLIGTIDGAGLFTASGTVGGVATVTATSGAAKGSTTVSVRIHVEENPGNVSPADQAKLKAGGAADADFKWLYPYDKTVFPRGLPAPVLQFAGTAPTATYVHITSKLLDYQGYFAGASPAQVTLSAATWKVISQSALANDPVSVEVTKLSGGVATGPVKETWAIAQGSLKGTVYYNSYSSPLAGDQGATLKVKVGQQAQVLFAGCTTCHSVSANGNVLAASAGHSLDATYDLTDGGAQMTTAGDGVFSFGGLSPNGEKVLTNGTASGSYPPNVPGTTGPRDSQLMNTKTGAVLPAAGFDGVVHTAMMPAFAQDGSKVAFNHFETGTGHSLAVMDFNDPTNTFSNLVDVAQDPAKYLGWPAFLPDAKTLLFHSDTSQDFATWQTAKASIKAVDLATKAPIALDALNGIAAGAPYLPYGAAEIDLNFEPTVLPVAVGGYYWVLFTSRRNYGNTICPAAGDPDQTSQRRKKLWVSAIDISAAPGADPSHPAFYLEGQELAAGNMRGFWALDPCKVRGSSCESGDECCGGFCRGGDGDAGLTCVTPPSGCAQEFETCKTAADCCGGDSLCVNGHCARPLPK
jgi:hypothetical protein